MPLLAPEFVFHSEGWLREHVVDVDNEGFVVSLRKRQMGDVVEQMPGYLIPGLVNAHCHLELSHLSGQIAEGIGMAGFIREVFRLRNAFSEDQQVASLSKAWHQLSDFCTVAVGDICNTDATVSIKQQHPELLTHSFLELPGLDPSRAERVWMHGETLRQAFLELPHSFTAHAPYSMSRTLLQRVYEHSRHLSIHLLESLAEIELFVNRQGPLADAFHDFGIVFPSFPDHHPLDYLLRDLDPQSRVIWVHGTLLRELDILRLMKQAPDSFFCLCPRSNRYLHGRSPDLSQFAAVRHRVCLGTDSLASNWDLDLWKEVREVLSLPHPPDFHTAVSWATTNGAHALGLGSKLGKFRPGLRPGVMWARYTDAEKLQKIA
ncbi:MAG: amidohydrolase family protein [Bacteroidia bacterium]|nr:amidohydrolase family protein [Bacteroidia bacterium]